MKRTFFILCIVSLLFLVGCTKNYLVTYNTNGANPIESVDVKGKEVLPLVTPANRVGFVFGGWYLEADFKTKVTEVTVTKNVTVYAKWDVAKYNVKFKDSDGTQFGNDVVVEHGKAATAPANPTRDGYTFAKWDKPFDNVTSDLVVMATYTIDKYDVKFVDHDNAQIGETIVVEHGKGATAPANPTRSGYTFAKWDKTFDNVTSDLVVMATYTINKYNVKFVDHDNTQIGDTVVVEHGEGINAPANPTRVGYTFDKWDKEFSNVTGDLTVKAVYKTIDYEIKYYSGDTLLDHSPVKYTIEEEVNLGTYNQDGFIFENWYSDKELKNVVTKITKGTHTNLSFYGKWLDETQKYTTSYELNGGSWTWTSGTVSTPANGIDSVSNLPELFMLDFYTYLKDNGLLSSTKVDSNLRKTNWTEFKKNYTDPVASYNWTTRNVYTNTDGYSQFFYESATGDSTTGKIISITGGFFGTEPYKTKYAHLANHLALLTKYKAYGSPADQFWNGEQAKAAAGFILDGYFYGTQGLKDGLFDGLRKTIPNTNVKYEITNQIVTKVDVDYFVTEYVQGLVFKLNYVPSKEGQVFMGWYDNIELSGNPVIQIEAGVSPATKYYAKWEPVV